MQEERLNHQQKVAKLDFTKLKFKLILLGWKPQQADAGIRQYRNILLLWLKYGDETTLPPSEDIDEIWHNHILDTKKYQADCDFLFGKFLHHYPYFGIDDQTDRNDLNNAFANTKRLYIKEFGEPLLNVRFKLRPFIKSWFS